MQQLKKPEALTGLSPFSQGSCGVGSLKLWYMVAYLSVRDRFPNQGRQKIPLPDTVLTTALDRQTDRWSPLSGDMMERA